MPAGKAPRTDQDIAFDVEVGKRIKHARIAAKMTQGELAAKAGVTFQQVQKYEKGVNRVAASRLASIADALGLRPSVFLEPGDVADTLEDAPLARAMALYKRCTPAQQQTVRDLLESFAG